MASKHPTGTCSTQGGAAAVLSTPHSALLAHLDVSLPHYHQLPPTSNRHTHSLPSPVPTCRGGSHCTTSNMRPYLRVRHLGQLQQTRCC
jgi:hypothetical protein